MGGAAAWTVPGFVVDELVGFGGSGEVWRAREESTGRVVALKRLRASGGVAERDRLRREAAMLAGVASPHLVRMRTALTTADGLVLVLDYAGGGSLASLLGSRRRLLAGEVVTIAEAVGAALRDVHLTGLVHADVTPSNVLFARDGTPLLSDFGVARLADAVGDRAGTPGFTDPAVLAGAMPSAASDVYGLAATCYAALVGAAPLPGDTAAEVLTALREGRRRSPAVHPSVPPDLVGALEAGLAADPAARPDLASFVAAVCAASPATRVRLTGAAVIESAAATEIDGEAAGSGSGGSGRDGEGAARRERPPRALRRSAAADGLAGRDATSRRRAAASRLHGVALAAERRLAGSPSPPRSEDPSAAMTASGRWVGGSRAAGSSAPRSPGSTRELPTRLGSSGAAPDASTRSLLGGRGVVVAALVCGLALLVGTVVAGTRWALAERTRSPAVAAVRGPSAHGRPVARSSGRGSPSDRPTVPAPSSSGAATHPESAEGRAGSGRAGGGISTATGEGERAVDAGPCGATAGAASGTPADAVADGFGAVLRRLDEQRDAAFAELDPALLRCVYLGSAAAYRTDLARLRALVGAGERAQGLRLRLRRVDVLARHGNEVVLRVRDDLPAYRLVDADGRAVVSFSGRGPRSWRVVLQPSADGWRIADIAEDPR